MTWKQAAADVFRGEDRNSGKAQSLTERAGVLLRYLKDLFREHPQTMRFLIARTIYADAMSALLTLGAVYAGTFLGRITSYNVCYTKLLRNGQSGHSSFTSLCELRPVPRL